MAERVGARTGSTETTKDRLKDVLSIAATGATAAITLGAASIPLALARGWLSRQAINVSSGVLARTLDK